MTTPVLIVTMGERTLRFSEPRLLRVGRSVDADVVLTAASASRHHAELRPFHDGWMLVDAGSHYGTSVDGVKIREHRVGQPALVQCGPEADGSSFTVALEDVGQPSGVITRERQRSFSPPTEISSAPPPVDVPVAPESPIWPTSIGHD